ncbi:MAG: HAD family hydrolase [Planctomycetaceae bacterium]|nr:HAD family hydrolase [Planctomycetaceae bacterium]
MAQTLLEYLDALDERDLIWPQPPDPEPLRAKPTLKPLSDVRAVTWSVYGTLLTIQDGELLHLHPEGVRNQVALEKTIEEFNMWFSMSRKPGQPWEYMLQQYRGVFDRMRMAGTKRKGDFPHVNSSVLWQTLVARLQQNEYTWDRATFGDEESYADKVACFFHASLQGTKAAPEAADTLLRLSQGGICIGILAETQPFTMAQLIKQLDLRTRLGSSDSLFSPGLLTESHRAGIRKPSPTLYALAVRRAQKAGLQPHQVLHVGHDLGHDLRLAREFGFCTALYVGDRNSCRVDAQQLKDPDLKPDRLITSLRQVVEIVGSF